MLVKARLNNWLKLYIPCMFKDYNCKFHTSKKYSAITYVISFKHKSPDLKACLYIPLFDYSMFEA